MYSGQISAGFNHLHCLVFSHKYHTQDIHHRSLDDLFGVQRLILGMFFFPLICGSASGLLLATPHGASTMLAGSLVLVLLGLAVRRFSDKLPEAESPET